MKLKALIISITLVFLFGCTTTDVVGHLDDHPAFSPIVQRNAKSGYQVVWSRSWKPIIYIKAHIEQDEWGELQRAYVTYGAGEHTVPKLKKIEITVNQWLSIVNAIENSSIWSYGSKCAERAYRDRRIYFDDKDSGDCEEIIMTDGATISIAVSEPERKIGIYTICSDLGNCDPLGRIPRAMLKTIGREHEAN